MEIGIYWLLKVLRKFMFLLESVDFDIVKYIVNFD